MKPREPRRAVMIDARLRQPSGWSDARILNISSRGLMLHAPQAPGRGAYVEICRGPYVIVARVVWSRDQSFGVVTQDALPVDRITCGIEAPQRSVNAAGCLEAERRARRRRAGPAERHEHSRRRARAAEYACGILFGAVAAALAFDGIEQALAQPLAMVGAALGDG